MEYTELADYPLPAGVVTEWFPTAAADAWNSDDRRLSYAHLEHARRAVDVGDEWYSEWIGTAFTIDRPLDTAAMTRTLTNWYARHEAFRSTVSRSTEDVTGANRGVGANGDVGAAGTEDEFVRQIVGTDAVSISVARDAVSSSSNEVYERINELFNSAISPLRWPHCVAVTVEPDDTRDSFLLIFAADHTVMDAYTQVFAIRELTRLYEAALDGLDDPLPRSGSYVDFAHAERAQGANLHTGTAEVLRWTDFLRGHVESTPATQPHPMPAFPVPATDHDDVVEPNGNARPNSSDPSRFQASLSRWVLDADQTDRFHRACKAHGANMQAGVFTALSIANHRLSGTGDLRFISPVHTRTELQWGEAAGWFVGLVPVHLRTGDARLFSQALGPVAASSREYRELGTVPFHPIADLIGHKSPPGFVVSYIDLRRADGADQWDGQNARALRSASASCDDVYFWINRISTGTNISARFASTHPGATRVHRFLRSFTDVLLEVAADGDTAFDASVVASSEHGSAGNAS